MFVSFVSFFFSCFFEKLNQKTQVYKVDFETFSVDPSNELSQDTIMTIFSNVESIRALSQNLSELLTTQMKNWTSVQTIGDIFVKIV